MDYYAHSGRDEEHYSDWQLLREHLSGVATRAAALASKVRTQEWFPLTEAARTAGLLHDIGKFRPEFQQMLFGMRVAREKTYHKQAGAAKSQAFWPIAFAIAGHHGGIPDKVDLVEAIKGDSGADLLSRIWNDAVSDCPDLAALSLPSLGNGGDVLAAELYTRVLFACLVDSDWSDTSEHERIVNGWPDDPTPAPFDPARRLPQVLGYIQEKAAGCEEPRMARLRDEVLQECLRAAELAPGLFSLTVPTGGGKTLSSLAFALKHATHYDPESTRIRRVVYVAPYLSILDQNATVFRKALGVKSNDGLVFEHHSLAETPGDRDPDRPADEDQNETRSRALRRAENWDSPFILTTNVQFFESLFSNRPGRCRKLHNIAGSVILLDECQAIPPDLFASTCEMLQQLVTNLGCTIVSCTATQPAFSHPELSKRKCALVGVREIIPPHLALFSRLQRVHVTWPKRQDEVMDWKTVGERMTQENSALCVVNTRKAAQLLFDEVKRQDGRGVFHLSTCMCPMHRLAVLARVKARLARKKVCRLISTQLIEAGVDVDFDFLMREIGPLEAVIQAAGRCNREGKLNHPDGTPGGRVVIFRSVEGKIPNDLWYREGRNIVECNFLNSERGEPRINVTADIEEYYERLFKVGSLDKNKIRPARRELKFREVADRFRIIDDDSVAVVVATWDQAGARAKVDAILKELHQRPTRGLLRRLAPYQVNMRSREATMHPDVREEIPGVFVWRGPYDPDVGVTDEFKNNNMLCF
jgi:CRISPR-associated endonuclease/helicase Cas3